MRNRLRASLSVSWHASNIRPFSRVGYESFYSTGKKGQAGKFKDYKKEWQTLQEERLNSKDNDKKGWKKLLQEQMKLQDNVKEKGKKKQSGKKKGARKNEAKRKEAKTQLKKQNDSIEREENSGSMREIKAYDWMEAMKVWKSMEASLSVTNANLSSLVNGFNGFVGNISRHNEEEVTLAVARKFGVYNAGKKDFHLADSNPQILGEDVFADRKERVLFNYKKVDFTTGNIEYELDGLIFPNRSNEFRKLELLNRSLGRRRKIVLHNRTYKYNNQLLSNPDNVMVVVEAKQTVCRDDIVKFKRIVDRINEESERFFGGRVAIGYIGGPQFPDDLREGARKAGLGVVLLSGERFLASSIMGVSSPPGAPPREKRKGHCEPIINQPISNKG